jgi:hypothetical protein
VFRALTVSSDDSHRRRDNLTSNNYFHFSSSRFDSYSRTIIPRRTNTPSTADSYLIMLATSVRYVIFVTLSTISHFGLSSE